MTAEPKTITTSFNANTTRGSTVQGDVGVSQSTQFGFFLPPFHSPSISPYLALQHDIKLCCLLDELGFDEVWLGEHHSTGWSTLSSAEMLIAALARETRRIRFATGVIPLPYHHPLHTAERILLLDHLTDGRTILGCGTGTYVHDMEMIGVDPMYRHAHFRAALNVVQALINGETVDATTQWFITKKAVLQLRPLRGAIETVLASSLAGKAVDLLLETSTSPIVHIVPPWGMVRPGVPPWGVGSDTNPLPSLIQRAAEYRKKAGDQARIRCCVFVHICESTAKGIEELMPGWSAQRNSLWHDIIGLPVPDSTVSHLATIKILIDADIFIVGDAATCTRKLRDLADRLGSPVSFIFLVPGWVSYAATLDQATTLAREVIPELFCMFRGMEESMKLTSQEASRQIKRRSTST